MRTPRVVQTDPCPCDRPTVLTAEGKLLLCAGTCDASPRFCTCKVIATRADLGRLLDAVMGRDA